MLSLLSISEAQDLLRQQVREIRLNQGFTQAGLAKRAGVPLPSLRLFEQKGQISLESLLKILMVLGCLAEFTSALQNVSPQYKSIDDALKSREIKQRKQGWRK